jgi:hypothetical protein
MCALINFKMGFISYWFKRGDINVYRAPTKMGKHIGCTSDRHTIMNAVSDHKAFENNITDNTHRIK